MEEKLKEVPVMQEDEFKEYVHNKVDNDFKNGILHLHSFEGVSKFKSIRRAIKRGLVSPYGEVYPKRPFNNKANTCKRKGHNSRGTNEFKKMIYGQLKHRKTEL